MSQFPEEPLSSSAEAGLGYFPVSPSQTLKNGHYAIIRKLGWGPRSSVWLATYLHEPTVIEYCVIKILTAHATDEHKSQGSQEVKTLEAVKPQAGFNHLSVLYDTFTESSTHGTHLCIVTLNILPDIDRTFRLSAPDQYLRVHTVRKIIASIAESLHYLHQRNIIHGAVKPDNFSFGISTIPRFLEPILAGLPPVDVRPPVAVDGVEYPIAISQPLLHSNRWDDDRASTADYNVYLNNFGHARRVNKKARWCAQNPSSLRPPEVIFGNSLTQKVDVWMLGCATFLLLTGESLFSSEPQGDIDYLAGITQLTGETFDAVGWKESSRYDEFFLQSGQLKKTGLTDSNSALEARLRSLSRLSVADAKPAAEFIAYCLKVDPAKRPSAQDLMDHSWLMSGYECSCGFCMR